jgi:hypothetical protein
MAAPPGCFAAANWSGPLTFPSPCFLAANDHPDHDTIATFQGRFLKEIEALFVKVLLLAREIGVLKMGD